MEKDSLLPLRCQRLRELRGDKTQKEMATLLDVEEKTYRSWEKGEYRKGRTEKVYPQPDLENLIKMSDIFRCSIDYLLCRSDCTSVDNHYISLKTGLSDKAIKILMDWNKIGGSPGSSYVWARNSIKAINDLIGQGIYLSNDVLNPIADYIYYRSIFESPSYTRRERNKALDKFRLSLFTATNGLTDCIKAIYKDTKKAPDTN